MKKTILCSLVMLLTSFSAHAVSVTLTTDEGYNNPAMVQKLQNNLAALLNEINAAYNQKRNLNLGGLPIDDSAKDELATLWDMTHFYVDEEEVVDRLWPLSNSFLVRQIPLIMDPDGDVVKQSTFQEASITLDKNATISG